MKEILCVAAGGAIGAVVRHLVSLGVPRAASGLPWSTMLVNVLGSLALGLLAGAASRVSVSAELRAFLGVGLLGALTTFSTFSVETLALLRAGRPGTAGLNLLANVVLSLGAAGLGLWWMQRGR